MDFIEVLIILIFIVIPILEGVLKQRRAGKQAPLPGPRPEREPEREPEHVGAGATTGEAGGSGAPPRRVDEGPAADMIPSDLWEILTGEKRPHPVPPEAPWEEQRWEEAPSTEVESGEITTDEEWISTEWEPEDEVGLAPAPTETREPVSLEYVGPEAISLEGPPPPPEIRHRLFHRKYDEGEIGAPAPVRRRSRDTDLRAALTGAGLRRAVILSEILGPPKGLA